MRIRIVLSAFAVSCIAVSSLAFGQASRAVSTDDAPKAAGPYSQAIVSGGFLFAAGQTPRDPKTNQQVTGTFEVSVQRVLDNLEAILKADGLTWADVVKTTVYLTKADDFAALNTVYAKRMGDAKPARTSVFVASLPGGAVMEMELIAKAKR
jgi:2-iminobutanoate/2-iminopropanoate deaminase